MINALADVPGLHLKVVGVADEPEAQIFFENEVKKHGLEKRVSFLGRVDDEELLDLYARSLGVFYAPFDEDYGYVTLEAMASGKPVITATDSGGTLEFVRDEVNGLIVAPSAQGVASACTRLMREPSFADNLGARGRGFIVESGMHVAGWDPVIQGLLSPLEIRDRAQCQAV